MTQRTCNIIMCCKGNSKYSNKGDSIYSIKRYMGDECIYNWENYTDAMIQDILYTALMDYIDWVKKPSFVLWCLKNDGRLHENINEKICAMFANVKVRDDHGYVNGFTQEQISKSNLVLYGGTNNV